VSDNVYCLVKIIEKDERIIAAFNLKLNCLIFSISLNSSLVIFIRTYTVNYRNALDRLRIRMNIILFIMKIKDLTVNCTVGTCKIEQMSSITL